jgi:hydroxyacyl-ACP dehydratase HTD2-like protein with hotdog domain
MSTPATIQPGEALPSQERRPTHVGVFLYAAAVWTPHRIHYDQAHARAEGYPDILVHGPLLASYALQTITDWLGGAGRVVQYDYRNLGMAHPGDVLTAGAVLQARDGNALTFTVWLDRATQRLLEGTVQVELF